MIDSLAVLNEDNKELVVFLVNRSEKEEKVDICTRPMNITKIKSSEVLFHSNIKTNNVENHDAVKPQAIDNYELKDNNISLLLKPFSFQRINIGLELG